MRPTPFRAVPPRNGRQWTVVDADSKEVCECDGLDDGAAEAVGIVQAVNGVQLVREAKALHANVVFARVQEDTFSNRGHRLARLAEMVRHRILRRARAL